MVFFVRLYYCSSQIIILVLTKIEKLFSSKRQQDVNNLNIKPNRTLNAWFFDFYTLN